VQCGVSGRYDRQAARTVVRLAMGLIWVCPLLWRKDFPMRRTSNFASNEITPTYRSGTHWPNSMPTSICNRYWGGCWYAALDGQITP
jgi:hypothetical protein